MVLVTFAETKVTRSLASGSFASAFRLQLSVLA
jgi:hypothetical protein